MERRCAAGNGAARGGTGGGGSVDRSKEPRPLRSLPSSSPSALSESLTSPGGPPCRSHRWPAPASALVSDPPPPPPHVSTRRARSVEVLDTRESRRVCRPG